MAPLQKLSMLMDKVPATCHHLDTGVQTGPHAAQYFDLSGEYNIIGGRADERHGWQGSFTHGVTTFAGGVPRFVPPSTENTNHGIVLFTSKTLKPDLREQQQLKPGTTDERQAPATPQARWRRTAPGATCLTEIANRGTVLATFPNLKADMTCEGPTMNVVGGRPTECLGARGGFTPGVRVLKGGSPRDVAPPADLSNRGTVLYTSVLRPNMAWSGPELKRGTDGERLGRVGSFQPGASRLRMPTAADAQLWQEPGQNKGGRRFGPGHFLAGTTTWGGIVQAY